MTYITQNAIKVLVDSLILKQLSIKLRDQVTCVAPSAMNLEDCMKRHVDRPEVTQYANNRSHRILIVESFTFRQRILKKR